MEKSLARMHEPSDVQVEVLQCRVVVFAVRKWEKSGRLEGRKQGTQTSLARLNTHVQSIHAATGLRDDDLLRDCFCSRSWRGTDCQPVTSGRPKEPLIIGDCVCSASTGRDTRRGEKYSELMLFPDGEIGRPFEL